MPEAGNMPHNMPEGFSKQGEKERLKKRYQWLKSFSDDELDQISLCYDPGYTMKEGELYFDLEAPERGIMRGRGGEKVENGHCVVAKKDLSEATWNKLTQPFQKK
jgi:hypothetical protein